MKIMFLQTDALNEVAVTKMLSTPSCFARDFHGRGNKHYAIQDNAVFIKSPPLSSESFILMFFVLHSRTLFDEFDW